MSSWFNPLVFQRSPDISSWAKNYLSCIVPLMKRPAVVFDIDGTLLKGESEKTSKKNPAVAAIYDWCIKHNIDCFVVTARMETLPGIKAPINMRNKTERELVRLGFDKYKKLFMFNETMAQRHRNDPAPFKRKVRHSLRENGYQIILNVGDMWTDHTVEKDDGDRVSKCKKCVNKCDYAVFPTFDQTYCSMEVCIKLPED